jgi:hypothetical protein
MGTQGLAGHAVFGGVGGFRARRRPIAALAASLAILSLTAGCSGFSFPSFGSSNPQAAVQPPADASGTATGQSAYAPPPGQAQSGAYAAAPPAQAAASSESGTVGSFSSSYVSFVKAFRDLDPDSPEARPPARSQQSGAAPQQNAYAPHPPSTYVPDGQPYNPPPSAEPAYAPVLAQQTDAAPPPARQNPQRSAQQTAAPPSSKQTKAARASSQQKAAAAPARPAAAAPAPAPPPAAAQQDYSDSLPYPKQSLTDVFRGSTEPQTQTVPRPPTSYTPSGQPYTPQGQAAAAPAVQNPSDSLPYPKQSLFEIFSNNK